MGAEQLSLLGHSAAAFDPGFSDAQRRWLDPESWVDYVPGWVRGHAEVFAALRDRTSWHSERRRMYERVVDVPRLTAMLPRDGPGHAIIPALAAALGERYGSIFDSIGMALYRDGADSVAWHRDRNLRDRDNSLVALVSLGGPRPFMIRPFGGGASISYSVGWGDVVVMGGATQLNWEHGIPKVREANPRIALMFRPSDEIWERQREVPASRTIARRA